MGVRLQTGTTYAFGQLFPSICFRFISPLGACFNSHLDLTRHSNFFDAQFLSTLQAFKCRLYLYIRKYLLKRFFWILAEV